MVDCYLLNALVITFIILTIAFVIYLIALAVGKIIRTTKAKIDVLKWNINSAKDCGEYAHRRIDDINEAMFRMNNEIEKLKGEKKNVKKEKCN